MGDGRQDTAGPPPSQGHRRISVQEAAEHLETTVGAIRKRVQRDAIAHDKDSDGRVWILLDTDMPRHDSGQDATGQRQDTGSEMVEELRGQIAYLERQVVEEREARRRADTILAQLSAANAERARTIRAIEGPREAPEPAETVEEEPDGLGGALARFRESSDGPSAVVAGEWIGAALVAQSVGEIGKVQWTSQS